LFIDYFIRNGHWEIPSSPLLPKDDPTLLFTSAGMVQFKPLFSGIRPSPHKRVVSIQKCLRGSDINEIKTTGRHHSFFEMLGNFSFGDYFKEEAIIWAWQFLTEIVGLDKESLTVTVYSSDDESYEVWEALGISPEKILRLKDNFWGPAGSSGPCGPCTEILYQEIELWNIVFLEYEQSASGDRKPLKKRGVDTGMGLERLTMICQGKKTSYETDLFLPIIEEIEEILNLDYNSHREPINIIADHIRALVFALSEGIYPSNESRGYFVRYILRRALLEGARCEKKEPFLYKLVPVITELMREPYPEIWDKQETVSVLVKNEEERFISTLERGTTLLFQMLPTLSGNKVPSSMVFRLYDTYGFPVELTAEIAKEKGFYVDIKEVERIAHKNKELSRKASMFKKEGEKEWRELIKIENDEFVGYDTLRLKSKIARMRKDGENLQIILTRTPFYGESGGQVGDRGMLYSDKFEIEVLDTKIVDGFHLHIGMCKKSLQEIEGDVTSVVNEERRRLIQANHTATHLLHSALRNILGEHIRQEGSWVGMEKLRFDFTHFSSLNSDEIERIEDLVNLWIVQDIPVTVRRTTLKQAKKLGATALFEERYEDKVRLVHIGEISLELCSGTHVRTTGLIGGFRILSETGVHAGIRRMEAITSLGVIKYLKMCETVIKTAERLLKTKEIPAGIIRLKKENQELKKRVRKLSKGGEAKLKKVRIDGVDLVRGYLPELGTEELRELSDVVRKSRKTICVLATRTDEKPLFVVSVSDDIKREFSASRLAASIGKLAGGGGGGRPHLATAGGRRDVDVERVLEEVEGIMNYEV